MVPAALYLGQVDVRSRSTKRNGGNDVVNDVQNQLGHPSGLGLGGGPGSGGGGDDSPYDEPQVSSIVIPCPPDSETCKLVGAGDNTQ